jgi:uncharacterized caspase-like protein
MTWTKLSDDWTDDTWTLSDAAHRLHTDALVWSNRKLLDLRIPKEDLPRLSRASESVSELLDGSWWKDEGDHYLIQHHGIYQRTRAQVIKQQEANRLNGRQGGRPGRERHAPKTTPVTQSVSESLSELQSGSETERDGTGQDKNSLTEQQQTHTRTAAETARATGCYSCQRAAGFNPDGPPCPEHRTAA